MESRLGVYGRSQMCQRCSGGSCESSGIEDIGEWYPMLSSYMIGKSCSKAASNIPTLPILEPEGESTVTEGTVQEADSASVRLRCIRMIVVQTSIGFDSWA